jgi:hypothetical protein
MSGALNQRSIAPVLVLVPVPVPVPVSMPVPGPNKSVLLVRAMRRRWATLSGARKHMCCLSNLSISVLLC